MNVLPLVRLCAVPLSQAETPICSFHLQFGTIIFTPYIFNMYLKWLLIKTFLHTLYSGFLFISEMFGPGPDYHIHIVHTENLRKPPKSIIICELEIVASTLTGSTLQLTLSENVSFQQTFASNPLTTSVFSLLQPQIPDLILLKDKHYPCDILQIGQPYNKAL